MQPSPRILTLLKAPRQELAAIEQDLNKCEAQAASLGASK